ncbi:hypothetical protein QBC35DRAFT_371195 [Podospora australis]|uniref:Atos-like conserved domain-containing protein n=1 Tax=Podospora australis TaxID=1536484 RepID=A0AAN6X4C2_9PEZI|nr:hypothetical protein QBC35DRAFT_371195 [Podospora australis]
MPMLRDDALGQPAAVPEAELDLIDEIPAQVDTVVQRSLRRQLSEESIRTELCEGPIPDSPPVETSVSHPVSDRAELIERLKRGESPTWVPNRHLESLFQQDQTSPPRTPQRTSSMLPGLLPAPSITPEQQDSAGNRALLGTDSRMQDGLTIERPRSALHSGNFTPQERSPGDEDGHGTRARRHDDPFQANHHTWVSTSPPRDFTPFSFAAAGATDHRKDAFGTPGPSSLSSSLSSNFVYKPPTSPLVQSESNDELDLTLPLNSINIASNSPRNSRRHTLNFTHSPLGNFAGQRQISLRREGTYPYQAHQPRRSLNSTPLFPINTSSPQNRDLFSTRRQSFSSEVSPVFHASLVGSYEESILRGRMSTNPSKPLEFMAQIGVLGLGKCKPSLRCPSHVTLPFSAVFYSYASTSHGRSKTDDGPSPYVGQIDLENGLTNPEDGQRAKRKLQSRYQDRKSAIEDELSGQVDHGDVCEGADSRQAVNQKRRSRSPKAPPGGRYRIPEKGQLQIIIKNQNKTAVKLFLVPYDLSGMEAGTKTFIRQRSYSAGPVLETKVPDMPAAAADSNTLGSDRATLRYLVHLHICCPSKGRFYLYKSIRVVFANRVPDGKERLRNEVTHPEPRFSPYKPVRVMHPPTQTTTGNNNTSSSLAAEQAFRRRSVAHAASPHFHHPPPQFSHSFHHNQHHNTLKTVLPTPAAADDNNTPYPRTSSAASPSSPGDDTTTTIIMPGLEMTGMMMVTTTTKYDKLNKGDIGYGGLLLTTSSSSTGGVAREGLLSQRLRSWGAQSPRQLLEESNDSSTGGETVPE